MGRWILGLFLVFNLSSQAFGAPRTEKYIGEARKDGKLIYIEKHTVRFDEKGDVIDAETIYEEPSGDLIGTLKSDFRSSLTAPDHTYHNNYDGSVQGIRSTDKAFTLFSKDKDKEEKTKELPKDFSKDALAVGCQGLHYFLVKNMSEVKSKKKFPLKFLIPGTLDYYNFHMELVKESADQIEIEIEIDNWFLRLFAPKLIARYDTKNGRLLWYKGLSNVLTKTGKQQSVEITYKYES